MARIKPKVLLVDDEPSVLEALDVLLTKEGTVTVVGKAKDASSAAFAAHRLDPDLIVMDYNLPGKSGVEATREIRLFLPNVKVLFFSGYPTAAEAALLAGAQGFVLKGGPLQRLVDALRTIWGGGVYLDEAIWKSIHWGLMASRPPELDNLSTDERMISHLLLQGDSSKEIAEKLRMSTSRVNKLRDRLMKKLGVRNGPALAMKLAFLGEEVSPEMSGEGNVKLNN